MILLTGRPAAISRLRNSNICWQKLRPTGPVQTDHVNPRWVKEAGEESLFTNRTQPIGPAARILGAGGGIATLCRCHMVSGDELTDRGFCSQGQARPYASLHLSAVTHGPTRPVVRFRYGNYCSTKEQDDNPRLVSAW